VAELLWGLMGVFGRHLPQGGPETTRARSQQTAMQDKRPRKPYPRPLPQRLPRAMGGNAGEMRKMELMRCATYTES